MNIWKRITSNGNPVSPVVFCLFILVSSMVQAPSLYGAPAAPRHHLSISFELENHLLLGVSTLTLPAETAGRLHLGDLEITGITLNGEPFDTTAQPEPAANDSSHSGLSIAPAAMERTLKISFRMPLDPNIPRTEARIGPDGVTLTGFWHPTLDQEAWYELDADIPAGFSAVSEANEIVETATEAGRHLHCRTPTPLPSINFIAGPYVLTETPFGAGQKLYTYFFNEDQHLAAGYRDKALEYLAAYEKLLGPYPYDRFAIVENRLPSGYAMPGFTLLGQAVVNLPFIKDTSLRHEVLHSWFGNGVRIDSTLGNWGEGLTAYLAEHAQAEEQGRDAELRQGYLLKYQSYVKPGNTMALQDFYGGSSLDREGRKLQAIGYGKAAMLFHMLRTSLGDEAFFQALRLFYQRLKYQNASWENLAGGFEAMAETPLKDFFHQWLARPDIPELAAEAIDIEEREGRPVLTFNLVQKNEKPFQLRVPLRLKTPNREFDTTVSANESLTRVAIPLQDLPLEMSIDPDCNLMRHLDPEELAPVWSRFEGAEKKVAVVRDNDSLATFKPLIDLLLGLDCKIIPAATATDNDLKDAAVLFLDPAGPLCRSIFARIEHAASGFTLEVRRNPLNPEQVAVLVSSASPEETAKAANKIKHYDKYSFLHFENGQLKEKKITDSDKGQIYLLDQPPRGIEIRQTLAFDDIVSRLLDKRVIYCGELHANYQDHRLQLRLLRKLYERDPNLAIGMEMFDRESQGAIDDYLAGRIDEPEFLKQSGYFRKWGFDYRLYREMIDFAKRQQIPILALNLDKDVVSKIFKGGGPAALSPEESRGLATERDLDVAGYLSRLGEAFKMHDGPGGPSQEGRFSDFIQAQAAWDETMAATISDYLAANPQKRLLILAGAGHVDKENGIPPRVARRMSIEQAVVVNRADPEMNPDLADFLVFVPEENLPPAAMMGVMLADSEHGVRITGMPPHSEALKAGIKEKDIILALDGQEVATVEDIKIRMYYKKKGDTVRVRIKRQHAIFPDSTQEIEVKL